jgi:hypothetical protein
MSVNRLASRSIYYLIIRVPQFSLCPFPYYNSLAVVPMDIAKTPLTTKCTYKKGECIVQRLLLIGLSPERLSLQYDSQLVKLYNYNKLDSQNEEKTIIANVEEDNNDDTSSDNSS